VVVLPVPPFWLHIAMVLQFGISLFLLLVSFALSAANGYFRMVWNRSLLSVITLVGRKFVAHLHPAGAFAPDQECTC